jgi:hypothetical protein
MTLIRVKPTLDDGYDTTFQPTYEQPTRMTLHRRLRVPRDGLILEDRRIFQRRREMSQSRPEYQSDLRDSQFAFAYVIDCVADVGTNCNLAMTCHFNPPL